MFKVLIDTCVWLDIAKDRRQAPLLDLIDEMIRLEMLGLIIPRIVLEEFKNNKERVGRLCCNLWAWTQGAKTLPWPGHQAGWSSSC
jgi:hypothetical protein